MSDATIVNGPLIRDLRLAAFYTVSDLAVSIGLRPMVVRRLEASDTKILTVITGQQLVNLARALGTNVDALTGVDQVLSTDVSDDAVSLLALLHAQKGPVKQTLLANALDWDLSRLGSAREALNARLNPVGLTVQHTARGWRLALLGIPAIHTGRRRLIATQAEIHGLDRPTAKVLHEVTYSAPSPTESGGHPFSEERRRRLAFLESLGAIDHADTRATPSAALRYALNLPRPTTQRGATRVG